MKKSILAIVLAIATLVTFIVPASAWSWITDGKCEVASYKASLIKELNEDGTSKIVLDGEMDEHSATLARRETDRLIDLSPPCDRAYIHLDGVSYGVLQTEQIMT